MENVLVNQLLEEAFSNVNVTLVVALMAVGFLIKHWKLLDAIENTLIPPVLLLLSIITLVITDGFTVTSIMSAVVNAAVAVGLHQQGKNIFTVSVVPALTDFLSQLSAKNETTDDEEH